jgi:uncharacterized protein (TIGR03083 family)
MSENTWTLIHCERRKLVDDLQDLTYAQWHTASLCPGWDVHQALAHVVALTKQTPPKFVRRFVASGFRFDDMVAKDIARESSGTPAQTLTELAAHAGDTSAPPGPVDSWLGEVVVHGADIRRPLGMTYSVPVRTAVQVADFYKNSNLLIGAKKRIAGLRLVATDTDWSHGSGPEVTGPILSLVLAMTGRAAALSDLRGDGIRDLDAKMPVG